MTIEKLIKQYQVKIAECDSDIQRNKARITEAVGEWDHNIHRDAIAIAEAKRQVYFQMTKDLEDLND